jgi:hypothetical protein
VRRLQDKNSTLCMLVQQHISQEAMTIINKCCSKVLFSSKSRSGDDDGNPPPAQDAGGSVPATPLLQSDFSLIKSLMSGQQNFILSDP